MENIANALQSLNPWWAGKKIKPKELIERETQNELIKLLNLRQIKDVLGVRRCGKTTLLNLVINHLLAKNIKPEKIFFLSFDEINLGTAEFDEIEKTIFQLELHPEYLFLDEAQEKDNWEKWVKKLYDLNKFKQIFVSGSNAFLLSKDVGKLLSGRHITTNVFPFSFKEFLIANNWTNFSPAYLKSEENKLIYYLNKYLKDGGFPETIKKDKYSIKKILTNIYNDIISRDIATRHKIDVEKIDLVAKYLFTNISKEFSYNSLAKNTGLNIETAEKYLEYLQESFMLFKLNLFSYKLKTQFKQNKKIYSIDNGLRNSISFRFSEDLGQLYENAVFLELKRENKEIYYWKGKNEVDFLVKEGMKLTELIQVCKDIKNKKTKEREIKGILEAAKKFKATKATIITENQEKEEKIENITIKTIPLWKWLLKQKS